MKQVYLHNCVECGVETAKRSLLCDSCEPGYNACVVCGNEVRHPGTGCLTCECSAPKGGKS